MSGPRQPASLIKPAWALGLAVGLCFTAPGSRAEPPPGDAVARFLAERGLVEPPPAETSLAQQVRERASDWTSDLVVSAMNFLGVNYKRGGQSVEQGFDCSGFTRHVFEASVGLVLPRRAKEQAQTAGLLAVKRDELKPGDLVFFNTVRQAFSHVGIYVGEGKFIHAPRTGGQVRVEDMRVAYWAKRYNGARRAQPAPDAKAPALAAVSSTVTSGSAATTAAPAAQVPAQAGADKLP